MGKAERADVALVNGSGLFDEPWYRAQHPGIACDLPAAQYHLDLGWRFGHAPSPRFDPAAYRAANPDLAVTGMAPLLHYLRHGRAEGRRLWPAPEPAEEVETVGFSIILPTYDRAWILDEAIRSVLAQTHRRFELIVIDDGSRDGTPDHLRTLYAEEMAQGRLVLIALPRHLGVCTARNAGLAAARHDWIAYVDSDNIVEPHFLETFARGVRAHPAARSFYAVFFHEGQRRLYDRPFDLPALRRQNFIDMGVFVHHRDCVRAFGGFDERLRRLVDWDLLLTYAPHYPPVFLDTLVMIYREPPGAVRISTTESADLAFRQVRAKHGLDEHGAVREIHASRRERPAVVPAFLSD